MKKIDMNSMGVIVSTSLIAVAIIPLLIYLFINNYVIDINLSHLEKANAKAKAEHSLKVFNQEASYLGKVATDYAIWDEAYDKLISRDISWFKENLTNWLPQNQDIDLIVVADANSNIIDSYGLKLGTEAEILHEPVISRLTVVNYARPESYPHGFKIYQGDLYIMTASPVLKNYYKGKPVGVLILGKKVTPDTIALMQSNYDDDVFLTFNGKVLASQDNAEKALVHLKEFGRQGYQESFVAEDSLIIGNVPVIDFARKPIGRLFQIERRDIFTSTLTLMRRNGFIALGLSGLIILYLSVRLKNRIVAPIKALGVQISRMAQGQFLGSVEVRGPREIVFLGEAFNRLSKSLDAHKRENVSLKDVSRRDDLTSLYNHRYFHEYLKSRISSTKNITLLFIDIDYFKVINDVHGHVNGDKILKEIGKIIKENVSNTEKVFRYGGEEFAVILENFTPEKAFEAAEKIRTAIAACPVIQQFSGYFPVTVSIGLACWTHDAHNVQNLVNRAERAMYFAKKSGRNQCKFYSSSLDAISGEDSIRFTRQEMLIDSTYALAAAIDAKDNYTEKHSEMVTRFALQLAEKLNLTDQEKYMLRIGGLLHDVGKIGLPDSIIHKVGPLTEEDWNIIKNHTLIGSNIAKYIINAPEIDACIRYHHERWDGTGYPEGLKGEEIPLYARIICIADAFHAMVSDRPYRAARSGQEAFRDLKLNRGSQFDPQLVEKFIEAMSETFLKTAEQ